MISRSAIATAAVALLLPCALRAQGTLSTQGFGYPTGGLGTRALGAGGALGDVDPVSTSNDAALSLFNGSALYFQAEPEYRRISVGSASERTTIARYPLVTAAFPVSQTLFMGLSVSNFLDRSFETTTRSSQLLNGVAVGSTNRFRSDGALGDVRLSASWIPRSWLRVGVGAHAITGDNRLANLQTFDDSLSYARLGDTSTVGYTGSAYSAGVILSSERYGGLSAAYRAGSHLSLKRGDTTLMAANVPDRASVSAVFLGLRGAALAVRTSHESWTQMRSLGSQALRVQDTWDTSVGADVLGPRFLGQGLQLRAGYRWRDLPFGTSTSFVRERSYSIGAGTVLSRGRAALDVAGIRAMRDAASTSGVQENAWTLSVGVTVRP